MESHSEQHFDDLAKKVYKSTQIETPSFDFTSKVMAKLESETVITYKPLISKIGWLVIVAIITGISIYIFNTSTGESSFLNEVDYSVLTNNKVTSLLSSVTFSKTLMYAVLFLGLAWFVQVKMINQFVEKRLEF